MVQKKNVLQFQSEQSISMRPSHITGPIPRGTIGNNSIEELSNEDDDANGEKFTEADVNLVSFKNILDDKQRRESKLSNRTDERK